MHHLIYILYKRKANNNPALVATAKDREILALFVLGKTYEEIAAELGIKLKTVNTHIGNLVSKNNCQKADELVILYADWEMQNKKGKG